jgi:hypothetical protein
MRSPLYNGSLFPEAHECQGRISESGLSSLRASLMISKRLRFDWQCSVLWRFPERPFGSALVTQLGQANLDLTWRN